jgi:hypothetical protein
MVAVPCNVGGYNHNIGAATAEVTTIITVATAEVATRIF